MKHNFRINGQVKTMNFELGSGIYDKNGNEIFEGDKVKALTPDGNYEVGEVIFDEGTFMWEASSGWVTDLDSGGIYELEVVGHVDD